MLKEIISDIILYREAIETPSFLEAATKQFIVLPILRALGWQYNDLSNLDVFPEKDTGDGRVDYALQYNKQPVVFVECKKWSENIANSQDQLRRYASSMSVDIAVLTNGILWDLYLPSRISALGIKKVPWEDRIFCSINLEAQQEARSDFQRYLSKPNVEQGIAREAAEEAFQPKASDTPLPRRHYALPILIALDQLGGSAPTHKVLRRICQLMENDLRPIDLSQRPDGQVYWENRTHDIRRELVSRGLMRKDSQHGLWEISEAGRESLRPQTPDPPLPQSCYAIPILISLDQFGSSAPTHEILRRIRQLMVDELRPVDVSRRSDGQVYCESRTHAMRSELVNRGLMRDNSPRGIWEISDAGREYLLNNEENLNNG
jgi:hypothetical protein